MIRLGPFWALVLLLILSACLPSAPAHNRLKIFVANDGFYRLTGSALRAAGANLSSPETLQLFRGDREVAIRLQREGNDLKLDFYGRASDSPYSAYSVYWLRWGIEKGKRIADTNSPVPNSQAQDNVRDWVRITRPTLYVPQAGEQGNSWFWQALTAPMTTTITITLPYAVETPAQLRVNVWGSTQDPANPDHHVRVSFNDVRLNDESWDGQGAHTLVAVIPPAAVRSGDNVLRLVSPGDTQAAADVVLLNSVEVYYTRRLNALQDSLRFPAVRGLYRISGFSGDDVEVFDVTSPEDVTRIATKSIADRTVTFAAEGESPRRWIAVGPTGYQQPERIAPMLSTDVRERSREARYAVITHPDFVQALQPLLRYREQQGLKTTFVTTDEIYDGFGYGAESPLAIKEYIDSLDPRPRFVLLVGKASYDYRDYLGGANKNLVPTFLVDSPNLRQVGSDNWYAASSPDDARPAFAIGRIPAKTAEQVTRVVNKTIAFESTPHDADWRLQAVFVADDKEPSFKEMVDALSSKLPREMRSSKILLENHKGDVTATRSEILAQWNAGALALTYIGHGSIDTWAEGPLFSAANLSDVRNGERLPVLFTPTCLDGFFYHPQKDSLSEDLLFKPDGGIVAGIVPTGLSFADAQSELMIALFDELFQKKTKTLGEAMWLAKRRLAIDSATTREVIETFGLLGDPALTLN